MKVVADKTGSLIATSARFGALLSGASPEIVDSLTKFGEKIGVAFQVADDLLVNVGVKGTNHVMV